MKFAQYGLIVSLLSGVAATACGTNDPGAASGARADEVTGIGVETRSPSTIDNGGPLFGGLTAEQLQAPSFAVCSDEEIVSILRTANQGEVQLVSGIFDRLTNADARSFARRLIQDHTRMLNQLDLLIRARNFAVTTDNGIVREMQDETQLELAHLRTMAGTELDRSFVDHEALDHLKDLSLIDHMLLPSAKDPLLAATLRTARGAIQNHAQFAVQLQTRIEGACGGPSSSQGGGVTDAGAARHDSGGGIMTRDAGASDDADCDVDNGESASHDTGNACDGGAGDCPTATSATPL